MRDIEYLNTGILLSPHPCGIFFCPLVCYFSSNMWQNTEAIYQKRACTW